MNQTKAALRMFLVRGLGLRSANNLIRHFKHPEAALEANIPLGTNALAAAIQQYRDHISFIKKG